MRNEKRERVVSNIHMELRKEMYEYKELDELNPSKSTDTRSIKF